VVFSLCFLALLLPAKEDVQGEGSQDGEGAAEVAEVTRL
jgi:hypothetical protein